MSNQKKFLLVGSSVMELSMNAYRLPEHGETLTDDGGVAYLPAGGGGYMAAALAKLGADAALCSKLGADFHGQRLFDFYKDAGVNTAYLTVDRDLPTGLLVRIKDGTEAPRVLNYPGATEALTADVVADALTSFRPDAVVSDFRLPYPVLSAAARAAADKRIPVFLSAEGFTKDMNADDLPPAEVLCVSPALAHELTGIRPTGIGDTLSAATKVCRKIRAKNLVIPLGTRGTFLYHGTHYDLVPPYGTVKIPADLVGADSLFFAALSLAHMSDPDHIENSIAFASATVAYSATAGGGLPSFPTAAAMADFLAKTRR